MKFFFKFLIIFYTIFTSNLYSSTSEIPNEKVFDNPKKEVTTVEANKNKEHTEMNIKVNKFNIQEIRGHDIGDGKVQYYIPNKTKSENKANYIVFNSKKNLSNFINNKKYLLKNIDKQNPNIINHSVEQENSGDLVIVDSSNQVFIAKVLENNAEFFKASPFIESRNYKWDKLEGYWRNDITDIKKNRVILAFVSNAFGEGDILGGWWAKKINTELKSYSNGFIVKKLDDYYSWPDIKNYFELESLGFGLVFNKRSSRSTFYGKGIVDAAGHYLGSNVELGNNETFGLIRKSQEFGTKGDIGVNGSIREKLEHCSFRINNVEILKQHLGVYEVDFEVLYEGEDGRRVNGIYYLGGKRRFIIEDIGNQMTTYNVNVDQGKTKTFDTTLSFFNRQNTNGIRFRGTDGAVSSNGILRTEFEGNTFTIQYTQNPGEKAKVIFNIEKFVKPFTYGYTLGEYFNSTDGVTKDCKISHHVNTLEVTGSTPVVEPRPTEINLDITKAIPGEKYRIDLMKQTVESDSYRANKQLDKELHTLILSNKVNVSSRDKLEMFIGNKQITDSYSDEFIEIEKGNSVRLNFIRKESTNLPAPISIKLKYLNGSSVRKIYNLNITNTISKNNDFKYIVDVDPRFFKAVENNRENKINYYGMINGQSYERLFKNRGSILNSNNVVKAIGKVDRNVNIIVNDASNNVTAPNHEFIKGVNLVEFLKKGYITNLNSNIGNNIKSTNVMYLDNANLYNNLTLKLDYENGNSKYTKDRVFDGSGEIDTSRMQKNEEYQITQSTASLSQKSNNFTMNIEKHSGDFITTGTAFDENRNIVNKIVVTDLSSSGSSSKGKINGVNVWSDGEVEIEISTNSLLVKKLQDLSKNKTLQIEYYYNDLKLGRYTLTLKNIKSSVTIEGIESINFTTLLPGSSQTLEGQFTISAPSQIVSRVDIPTNANMIKEGGIDIIPLNIASSTQQEGTKVKGNISVTANVPKKATAGTYSGTIDLTVTIE